MRSNVRLWRWRRNSLRRRSDLIESWAMLFAAFVMLLGAPAAGWGAGRAANAALERTRHAQQAERSQVSALVLGAATDAPANSDPETSQFGDDQRSVLARWTAPDGSGHTGTVRTYGRPAAGELILLWTDRAGRPTSPPMDAVQARTHATLAGAAAAFASALAVLVLFRLLRRQLIRRRLMDWERGWARVAPQWGRAGADG